MRWHQLLKLMDQDARTAAAGKLGERRDPFKLPPGMAAAAKPAPEPPKAVLPTLTPETLGLTLTSTIIGPQRRVARINGKTYSEGQTLQLVRDGQQVAVKITEVRPRSVVLSHANGQCELRIAAPKQSGAIELLRAEP
jgi:hypothetical protein